MTNDTVAGSTQRHGLTGAIALALQLILQHNGIADGPAVGIAWGVATSIGAALRWLISPA